MSDTALAPPPQTPTGSPNVPTRTELFLAFLKITLVSFGGALPWTRRMFVEEKKWMTAQEFNDAYALCQFLPGPNIVNLAAVFGWRMQGLSGAVAAWTGFLVFPFVLMVAAGIVYAHYSDVDALRRALHGLAAAAAGLLIATVIKMALPLFRSLGPGPLVVLAVGGAIGLMRWPLVAVLLVLVPLSVALAWWERR